MDSFRKQLTAECHLVQASRLRSFHNPDGEMLAALRIHAAPPSAIGHPPSFLGRSAAFTLIESVVAIGIFAFVIVGIVGLFGSALERQRQASFETRSVMVSQQILARIRAANSASNLFITRGTGTNEEKLFHATNISSTTSNAISFYFKKDGTEISGLTPSENYVSANYIPFPGYNADGAPQDIVGRARATLTANETGITNLYRVTIEVSEPANLPIEARRYTNTFTTFATFPN
jgi:type II secretory pathway pseudopilin PulG